jgi:hypothetical protein
MDPIAEPRDELRRSVSGGAWYGPALLEALAGFSAAEAHARPISAAHTPWEIALHALGWMEEVTRRLHGGTPALPERGDWPAAEEITETAWTQLRVEITAATRPWMQRWRRSRPSGW